MESTKTFEGDRVWRPCVNWLAVRDDFRNWVSLGLQPAKRNENRSAGQNGAGGSGEIESSQWSRRGRATVWSGACVIDRIIERRWAQVTPTIARDPD